MAMDIAQATSKKDTENALVLIGIRSSGKSATANTLTNDPKYFRSEPGSLSKSLTCSEGKIINSRIKVVDTPAVEVNDNTIVSYLTERSFDQIVYGVVVRIGRYDVDFKEIKPILQHLSSKCKSEHNKNSVILIFTCACELLEMENSEACSDRMKTELNEYISQSPSLRKFSKDFEFHYCVDNIYWPQRGKNLFIEEITEACEFYFSKRADEHQYSPPFNFQINCKTEESKTQVRKHLPNALILVFTWRRGNSQYEEVRKCTKAALEKSKRDTGNSFDLIVYDFGKDFDTEMQMYDLENEFDKIYICLAVRAWSSEEIDYFKKTLEKFSVIVPIERRIVIRVFDDPNSISEPLKEATHNIDFVEGLENYYIEDIVQCLRS